MHKEFQLPFSTGS